MDANNITSFLISLIAQFGKKMKTNSTMAEYNLFPSGNSTAVMNNKKMVDDANIVLAHNLTSILLRNYQYDASILDSILKKSEK